MVRPLKVLTYNVHGCVGSDLKLDPGRIAEVRLNLKAGRYLSSTPISAYGGASAGSRSRRFWARAGWETPPAKAAIAF